LLSRESITLSSLCPQNGHVIAFTLYPALGLNFRAWHFVYWFVANALRNE
jgi:hypothetical protein